MYRLEIDSLLSSLSEECNLYNINNKYIIYIYACGFQLEVYINRLRNKKNHNLLFWRGNEGNKGNDPFYALKIQQIFLPTFWHFHSPYSPFPSCIGKLPPLFFKVFLKKAYKLRNFQTIWCNSLKNNQNCFDLYKLRNLQRLSSKRLKYERNLREIFTMFIFCAIYKHTKFKNQLMVVFQVS